jgi:hypothetical protein
MIGSGAIVKRRIVDGDRRAHTRTTASGMRRTGCGPGWRSRRTALGWMVAGVYALPQNPGKAVGATVVGSREVEPRVRGPSPRHGIGAAESSPRAHCPRRVDVVVDGISSLFWNPMRD